MKSIIISNDFHGTSYRVAAADKSRETVRRIRNHLCPSASIGCTCGNFMGARGDQNGHVFIERPDGGAEYVGKMP